VKPNQQLDCFGQIDAIRRRLSSTGEVWALFVDLCERYGALETAILAQKTAFLPLLVPRLGGKFAPFRVKFGVLAEVTGA